MTDVSVDLAFCAVFEDVVPGSRDKIQRMSNSIGHRTYTKIFDL